MSQGTQHPACRGSHLDTVSFGYCHPATNHFHKRASLSGFCGYHSISSLLSYLRGCSTAPKHHRYATHLPNILEIQDIIEEGWRAGINSKALLQTGGIRGTRKYIGTSEAETCLKTLNVHCYVMCIQSNKEKMACDQVMERLERYFMREPAIGENMLGKPPVYFQYSGHSTVVVGFETWKERKLVVPGVVQMASEHLTELVVFDSARPATEEVRKVRDEAMPFEKLKAFLPVMAGYRVSRYELQKYDRFELVFLEDPKLF